MRGYFAIGIENIKDAFNVGSLWRTADLSGTAFVRGQILHWNYLIDDRIHLHDRQAIQDAGQRHDEELAEKGPRR